MKVLLAIIFFLPTISFSQEELHITGKMHYGEVKSAAVLIVENGTDTTKFEIEKKKFTLPVLDTSKIYALIFTCGGKTKTISIKPSEAIEPQSMRLEIEWDY